MDQDTKELIVAFIAGLLFFVLISPLIVLAFSRWFTFLMSLF